MEDGWLLDSDTSLQVNFSCLKVLVDYFLAYKLEGKFFLASRLAGEPFLAQSSGNTSFGNLLRIDYHCNQYSISADWQMVFDPHCI